MQIVDFLFSSKTIMFFGILDVQKNSNCTKTNSYSFHVLRNKEAGQPKFNPDQVLTNG